MSSISDALNSKIDLVSLVQDYAELRQQGTNDWRCACPIHKGSNPTAFAVFEADNGLQMYKCHSCGCSGTAVNFYSDVTGLPFYATIEELAEKNGINLGNNESYQKQKSIIHRNTNDMLQYHKKVDGVRRHLIEKRCLTNEVIDEFKIGFDEQGDFLAYNNPRNTFAAIVFPIQDIYGSAIGFSKRRAGSDIDPKYVNSPTDKDGVFKKGDIFFNYNRVRKSIKGDKNIYVVEGFYDTISAYMQSLNSLGYLGGALTREHINILKGISKMHKGTTFIMAGDNDPTGIKETLKLRNDLQKYKANINVRVFCYPQELYEFPYADDKGITLRKIKDFNDILVLNTHGIMETKIAEFPTTHIDLRCLELILGNCKDIESEYREVDIFVKSVTNKMILSDIAVMLSKRWNKDITEVKQYLQVSGDSRVDEILAEFSTVGEAVAKYVEVSDMPVGSMGYPRIDYSFGGTASKEVVLIGAYSKIGKTDVLIEIILHSVLRLQMYCMAFSLEMAKERFIERMLAKLFEVDLYTLKDMMKSPDSARYIMEAREKLEKYLIIIDTNNLTLDEVRHRVELANLYKFDKPVQRVFIDYFQYLQGTTEFTDIERTAKGMKPFCKDLNVELYMLSQFSRADKPWERPSIASFKGGNSMESSFDKCILLWRPSKDPKMSEIEREAIKYETMVVIESRNGLRGEDTFKLLYNPKTSRLLEA